MAEQHPCEGVDFAPELRAYLADRIREFDAIPEKRRELLRRLSEHVKSQRDAGRPVRLVFICTHNSRRSQMAQIWATAAARYFGVEGVECFSVGTGATAFNPRAVAAIARSGVRIEKQDESTNPRYAIHFGKGEEPLFCFSKLYTQPPNPQGDFCAVMTCSEADENCPLIPGAPVRVAVPYEDPRFSDDTPDEATRYDECCREICREMMFVFSQL